MQQQSIIVMQANGHKPRTKIDLDEFLAAWICNQREFKGECLTTSDALALPLPKGANHSTLSQMKESPRSVFWRGVGLLLRKLQGPGSLDTCWAIDAFFDKNAEWMSVGTESQGKGRPIKMVRLTPQAQEYWIRLPEKQQSELLEAAERELLADCDEEPSEDLLPDQEAEALSVDVLLDVPTPAFAAVQPMQGSIDRSAIIERLVQSLAETPFQAYYRGSPAGQPVVGWAARLDAYFWPRPTNNRAKTERELADMIDRLSPLVRKRLEGTTWTDTDGAAAVAVTTDIFKWGGVRRSIPQISVDTVRSAVDSAIAGKQVDGALMNSAWTKLASLASASLCPERHQAIWDSRVSHSLIGRINALGAAADVVALFPQLGWIPGQGGTRRQKPAYASRWKRGYRSWEAHFAAAGIVREMVAYLNRHATTYGTPSPDQMWSVRDVEMVLFMDGY